LAARFNVRHCGLDVRHCGLLNGGLAHHLSPQSPTICHRNPHVRTHSVRPFFIPVSRLFTTSLKTTKKLQKNFHKGVKLEKFADDIYSRGKKYPKKIKLYVACQTE
jgi:hypothetical protein